VRIKDTEEERGKLKRNRRSLNGTKHWVISAVSNEEFWLGHMS